MSKITIIEDGFEYKATIIQTSGVTQDGNLRIYWQGEPKEIDMKQYIPIEWIRKMMDKYKDWEFDNFCESLIETWEKENEIDRCR